MAKTKSKGTAAGKRGACSKPWRAAHKGRAAERRRPHWAKRAMERLNARDRDGGDDQ
jgi:hypothetical protein